MRASCPVVCQGSRISLELGRSRYKFDQLHGSRAFPQTEIICGTIGVKRPLTEHLWKFCFGISETTRDARIPSSKLESRAPTFVREEYRHKSRRHGDLPVQRKVSVLYLREQLIKMF